MPITVISVAKSYSNRGNHVHRPGTKRHWYVYYLDDEGNFKTRRINTFEALLFRAVKCKRYRYACPDCGGQVLAFARSLKQDIECPHCGYITSLYELDDEALDALSNIDDEDE